MKKKVLAIIVTYNAEKWLQSCLGSLRESKFSVDVAVVDNHSTDNTVASIGQHYPDVVTYLHALDTNLGFGKAHNLVFKQDYVHLYDYYFLLNQDAAIADDGIERLLRVAESDISIGIVSPVHYFSEGKMDKWFEKYYVKGNLTQSIGGESVKEVSFVNAAIWLLKREIIETVGLFYEVFSHYGEDSNLVHRVLDSGYKLVVANNVTGFHYRNQEATGLDKKNSAEKYYISTLIRLLNPNTALKKEVFRSLMKFGKAFIYQVISLKFSEALNYIKVFLNLVMVFPKITSLRAL